MNNRIQILAAAAMLAATPAGAASLVAPVRPTCQAFQEGVSSDPFSGFSQMGVTLSIRTPGPGGALDKYLRTLDQSGPSYVVASSAFNGDYSGLGTCQGICFDVQLFDDGDSTQSSVFTPMKPHNLLAPNLTLVSGSLTATFIASPNLQISEPTGARPGWHTVCAPVGPLQNGLPPSSQDGSWTISSGNPADWPLILSNVTQVRLTAFDVTPNQSEEAGYDNVCIRPACQSSVNKDLKNGTGKTVDTLFMTIEGGFDTIDWHFDGNANPSDPTTYHVGTFSFLKTPPNTLLQWFGITPPVPPGHLFHAGFRVSGTTRILNMSWSSGGTAAGCAYQVNSAIQFPGDRPILLFTNDSNPPCKKTLYVGSVDVEWFDHEVPLADLNPFTSRAPLRTDSFGGNVMDVDPGGEKALRFPLVPPGNATYGMLRYTVSPSPGLGDPSDTFDFAQFALRSQLKCDVNGDGEVDKLDLSLISKARGQTPLPGDVRDSSGDNVLTPADVAACTPLCTRANCAAR